MKYAYKTELNPTPKQAMKIRESIGICRFLYNEYIAYNTRLYKMYQRGLLDSKQPYFITAKDFDKYINNKVKVKEKFGWINKCGSKPRKKAIVNAELAYKRYFAKRASLPKFKSRDNQDVSMYFPKNNIYDWIIKRHCVKVPTLGFVRLKEFGYLPVGVKVINGNVSYVGNKYFVSVTIEVPEVDIDKKIFNLENLAIDIKINKQKNLLERKLERAKKKLQRKISKTKAHSRNQEKQKLQIQILNQRLDFYKTDRFNKIIHQIVSKNPKNIILPDLNNLVDSKDKNLLHKAYEFRNRLLLKCNLEKINLLTDKNITCFDESITVVID